jgi:hypothetical protein
MFPLENEFVFLYCCYLTIIIYFIVKAQKTKLFFYKINLVILFIYSSWFLYLFFDANNFSGGGSLPMLLYPLFVLFAHLAIYGLFELIFYFKKK